MKNTILFVLLTCATAFAGKETPPGVEQGCDLVLPEVCNVSPWVTIRCQQGWRIVGVADFNQDGYPDLLFHNQDTGETTIWYMRAAQ